MSAEDLWPANCDCDMCQSVRRIEKMDDILDRLQWPHKTVLANGHAYIDADDPLLQDAAAEIRKLRNAYDFQVDANRSLVEAVFTSQKENEKLRDENARLKTALKAIADYPHGGTEAQLMRGYARMAAAPYAVEDK